MPDGGPATARTRPPAAASLRAAYRLIRPVLGPRALHHCLRWHKEARHRRAPDVFYPVQGGLTDVLFNPHDGVAGHLTKDTLTIHLYDSMIRRFHRTHMPHTDSFIARFAREVEFTITGPKPLT